MGSSPGSVQRLGWSRLVEPVVANSMLVRAVLAFLLFNAVEFGTWVAVLLYAYDATGPRSVGLVAVAQLLPAAIVAPIAASLGDRFDRRLVLGAGYVVQACVFTATAASMLLGAPPPLVYLLAAAATTSLVIARPTHGALLPSIARSPKELTAANALSGAVEGMGLLLGPLAAALILGPGTPGHVFAGGAGACVVAAVLVFGLQAPADVRSARRAVGRSRPRPDRPPRPPARDPLDVGHHGPVAGLRLLARHRHARLVVALLALRMVVSGAMDVLFVLLALDVFATGDRGAAVLNASLGAGTVVGGAAMFSLAGRRRLAPTLAASVAILGTALAVAGIAARADIAPFLIAIAGIGYAATDVVGRTILQRVTPDRVLARALGTVEGVGLGALAVGSLLVPLVAGVLGPATSLVVFALVLPVAIASVWRGLERMDREAVVPARALRLLLGSPILGLLPPPQLEWIARSARWVTIAAGETIIRQGDVGDAYYVIESGRVRVSRDGAELGVNDTPGYGFGEIALLRAVPRTATVVAVEPSVLLAIERPDFLEVMTGHEATRSAAESVADERSAGSPSP